MGTHPIFESDFDCLTERMPVSQIDWPVDNFDRIDRFTDPYLDRWNRTSVRATQPFFKDESTYLQWNADPFYYGCGSADTSGTPGPNCGSGKAEFPGTIFSMPYWMAKYEKFISE